MTEVAPSKASIIKGVFGCQPFSVALIGVGQLSKETGQVLGIASTYRI
jgi:hypothetical protein